MWRLDHHGNTICRLRRDVMQLVKSVDAAHRDVNPDPKFRELDRLYLPHIRPVPAFDSRDRRLKRENHCARIKIIVLRQEIHHGRTATLAR